VDPVLLEAVALALSEHIRPEQWLTYVPIWIALRLLDEGCYVSCSADSPLF
jgi:chloramphenicol-sensitive protein RarD